MLKCKKNIIILISVLLLISVFIITFFYFNIRINKKYPEAPIKTVAVGESIMLPNTYHNNHYIFTVNDYKLATMDEIYTMAPDYKSMVKNKEGNLLPDDQQRVYLVTAKIKGKNGDSLTNLIYNLQLESDSWCVSIDSELFTMLNQSYLLDKNSNLKRIKETTVVIPFPLYSIHVDKSKWETVDTHKFNLVLSIYPEKNIVVLKNKNV